MKTVAALLKPSPPIPMVPLGPTVTFQFLEIVIGTLIMSVLREVTGHSSINR